MTIVIYVKASLPEPAFDMRRRFIFLGEIVRRMTIASGVLFGWLLSASSSMVLVSAHQRESSG
jgi:hypothetical protein